VGTSQECSWNSSSLLYAIAPVVVPFPVKQNSR
jgi:hypothetical protein